MDEALDDQRRLNLPAVQPVALGESSSTSSSQSARYYAASQPSQTKGITKRPSTATLAQRPDVLLPATRRTPPFGSDETVIAGSFQDTRQKENTRHVLHDGGAVQSPEESSGEHSMSSSNGESGLTLSQSNMYKGVNSDEWDWISFIHAYAAGKWDPRLTPNPPRRTEISTNDEHEHLDHHRTRLPPFFRMVSTASASTALPRKRISGMSSSSSLTSKYSPGTSASGSDPTTGSQGTTASSLTSAHSLPASASHAPHPAPATWQSLPLKLRRQHTTHQLQENNLSASTPLLEPMPQLTLPTPNRSFISRSMSDTSATFSPTLIEEPSRPNCEQTHGLNAAAAAMRLAGDGIDVRPLALPSPEVELTDPFRGHTASILPWQRDVQEKVTPTSCATRPPDEASQGRKSRLNSFWEGLGDVSEGSDASTASSGKPPKKTIDSYPSSLPTISGSPLVTPDEVHSAPVTKVPTSILPASAPLIQSTKPSDGDYFGTASATRTDTSSTVMICEPQEHLSAETSQPQYLPVFETSPASSKSQYELARPVLDRTVSEPVGIYRTASPDPTTIDPVSDLDSASTQPHSDSFRPTHRRVREEAEFFQRGYLVPPMPPNEWERQKGLYKFNIVHTAKDANFDRITLLAKLVFNAKICLISLIDSDEQWFKSEFGLGRETYLRDESLCGHAILQNTSEPLVILDTHADWRFENNPMVVKHPFIRFYAGAPLRTSEGFNIGSLCIIDSEPRMEFGPRQRHTLKEFAAICMRELELWRDKIQLRIRDRIQNSMEQFTRECLEIDTQAQKGDPQQLLSSISMEKIYDRAAKLVKRTLDVEGAVLIDVSSFEEFDMPSSELSVLLHHSDPKQGPHSKPLSSAGFAQMAQFFKDFPDGKVSEAVLPACIRGLLPSNIHYALTVPILNIDKRPFAMLCAYNSSAKSKPYLEGHELSYLRAIGVIILSAVLKRRMILADKSKSLFISNISHELRTPLHGILAAAELLSGTDLTPNQASFLSTVQACGTSLVETVNHVLDFTKLSGNTKAGGSETAIRPARVDLAQLVEEATEGCWIGHRARHSSEIGSVYSPRDDEDAAAQNIRLRANVEIAVDIGYRPEGWDVICEKGGIRRCLMNILGNALKFTSDGYVHVTLRDLPRSSQTRDNRTRVELGVLDTGKGISEDFLKNQLFQPFSQENPLQPGTGLGLAIVNSIVCSESVNGKIEVSSTENVGTDIRIIFEAQAEPMAREKVDQPGRDWSRLGFCQPPLISLLGFSDLKGQKLLKKVITRYLERWWHFRVSFSEAELDESDIVLVNEEVEIVRQLTEGRVRDRPLLLMSSARGDPYVINAMDAYERTAGFARIMFKPVGPVALHAVLKLCINALRTGSSGPSNRSSSISSLGEVSCSPTRERYISRDLMVGASTLNRRRSDGTDLIGTSLPRPPLGPRSITHSTLPVGSTSVTVAPANSIIREESPDGLENPSTTIPVGQGGLLLKTSVGTLTGIMLLSILVVEDNTILRELLVKWLMSKGYRVNEAGDGQRGVEMFKSNAYNVVLLDMSMPVLDGVGAATAIRQFEQEQRQLHMRQFAPASDLRTSRLIALTGMSSREDKRRAFEAGVDGYLVKPVSFKTLHSIFKQLGIS